VGGWVRRNRWRVAAARRGLGYGQTDDGRVLADQFAQLPIIIGLIGPQRRWRCKSAKDQGEPTGVNQSCRFWREGAREKNGVAQREHAIQV
jgi:hypothetical protein